MTYPKDQLYFSSTFSQSTAAMHPLYFFDPWLGFKEKNLFFMLGGKEKKNPFPRKETNLKLFYIDMQVYVFQDIVTDLLNYAPNPWPWSWKERNKERKKDCVCTAFHVRSPSGPGWHGNCGYWNSLKSKSCNNIIIYAYMHGDCRQVMCAVRGWAEKRQITTKWRVFAYVYTCGAASLSPAWWGYCYLTISSLPS